MALSNVSYEIWTKSIYGFECWNFHFNLFAKLHGLWNKNQSINLTLIWYTNKTTEIPNLLQFPMRIFERFDIIKL